MLSTGRVTAEEMAVASNKASGSTHPYSPNLVKRPSLKQSQGPVSETLQKRCLKTLAFRPCQVSPEANSWLTALAMFSEQPLLHSGLIWVSRACLMDMTVNGWETIAPAMPATPAITAFYLQVRSLQGFTGFTWLQMTAYTVFLTKKQLNLPYRCASNPSQRPESPTPVQ